MQGQYSDNTIGFSFLLLKYEREYSLLRLFVSIDPTSYFGCVNLSFSLSKNSKNSRIFNKSNTLFSAHSHLVDEWHVRDKTVRHETNA